MEEHEQDTLHGLLLVTADPDPKVKVRFNIFGDMEPQRYRKYLDSYMRVSTIIDGDLSAYANEAFRNFETVVSSMRDFMKQTPTSRLEWVIGNWRQTAACSVLTFASALHLFQEQTLAKVRRANPDNASAEEKAKAIFSREYDRSFAYRLVHKLRNVLVHHSMACVGLVVNAAEETSPGGLILHRHTVVVPLLREKFLEAQRGVNAKMREELLALSDDPNLIVTCREALQSLKNAGRDLTELCYPDIHGDFETVCELEALFQGREGQKGLVRIPNVSTFGQEMRPAVMPHTTLQPIVFEYARANLQT